MARVLDAQDLSSWRQDLFMRDGAETNHAEHEARPLRMGLGSRPPYSLMLDLARRGLTLPESLTFEEVQSLCRTLIVQYAQIGIR